MGTDALIQAGSHYFALRRKIGDDAIQALLEGRAGVFALEPISDEGPGDVLVGKRLDHAPGQ